MDKEKQIKSTDWLTKGYSEEEIVRMKAEAIKEANAELRKKQVEEMAKHCHFYEEGKCLLFEDEAEECDAHCDMCEFAKRLYNADYRKASEVAREIFEVIEEMCFDFCGNFNHLYFAELKKKYTENKGE